MVMKVAVGKSEQSRLFC